MRYYVVEARARQRVEDLRMEGGKMNFPAIVVGRLHQRSSWARIVANGIDLLDIAYDTGNGFETSEYADEAALLTVFGEIPEGAGEAAKRGYPVREIGPTGESEWYSANDANQPDLLAAAIDWIGHDLNGLDVIESAEEYAEYVEDIPGGWEFWERFDREMLPVRHNMPGREMLDELARELKWIALDHGTSA